MPQVSAALLRSAPSKPIASANIRRDAALSFSRPAAARSSTAVKSLRVTAIAAIVLAPHHTKSSSIQTFSDSGTPTSHPFSPLVLVGTDGDPRPPGGWGYEPRPQAPHLAPSSKRLAKTPAMNKAHP